MSVTNKSRVHIKATGKVQGVFFRVNTKEKAQELNLRGWVKNLGNDKVEIVAEGSKQKLKELVEWAKQGSERASVDDIKIQWQENKNEFNKFKIKFL